MNVPRPQWTAYPGTERLGRPLTSEEQAALAALLRAHDFVGARLVALRFAFKLSRNKDTSKELLGRVHVRLIRGGWDPGEISLVKRLCRLVWSEWTNLLAERDAERRATQAFIEEVLATQPRQAPSAEEMMLEEARRRRREAEAKAQVEALRVEFQNAKDEVNLLWLDYSLEEIDDLQEMARRSGRDVSEFYRAAERRKRVVRRLLARKGGVHFEEDDES